ncbi:MAG: hypothetical protein ACXWWL_06515, partial [Candidatus Limnocylindria bacterium]
MSSGLRPYLESGEPAYGGLEEDMPPFKFNPAYSPVADQPTATAALAEGIEAGERFQTLLGVTG